MVMLEKIVWGFERVYGSQGYRIINELGDAIIGIATTYDLILTNIRFKERGNQI